MGGLNTMRNGAPYGAPFLCVRRIEMLVQIYVNSSFGPLLWLVEAGRHQTSAGDSIISVV